MARTNRDEGAWARSLREHPLPKGRKRPVPVRPKVTWREVLGCALSLLSLAFILGAVIK
jgi:hypothetical protein